jgi:hypothetical protein
VIEPFTSEGDFAYWYPPEYWKNHEMFIVLSWHTFLLFCPIKCQNETQVSNMLQDCLCSQFLHKIHRQYRQYCIHHTIFQLRRLSFEGLVNLYEVPNIKIWLAYSDLVHFMDSFTVFSLHSVPLRLSSFHSCHSVGYTSISAYKSVFPEVKWLGCGANHSPPSSAKVKMLSILHPVLPTA